MKKLLPYLVILLTLTGIIAGFYGYYLQYMSQQLVENWMRIEQVNIQQGNIFSSLATSNRILMSSGVIKSVMLFDVEHDQVSEMASYGEYITVGKLPELESGGIKSQLDGINGVLTFVRFKERPHLVAAFKTESADLSLIFAFMLTNLTFVVVGFALYVQKLARTEEAKRFTIIRSAMEDLLEEAPPRQFIINQMPHILNQWSHIRTAYDQLKEKLENSARDRIMAQTSQMLGHDLRAPLGTFERLLLIPDNEMPAMKQSIKESLNQLYSMIEALRNSKTENIVRRSSTTFRFQHGFENIRLKAEERNIFLQVPQFDLILTVDKQKLERAWLNLTLNAIEFAKTKVKVDAIIRGHELIITVIDDGPGIPEDFLPKLFQRGATHGKPDGTGLGLAYVRQIMRGHGGDVTYHRDNGQTIFECRIPHAVIETQGVSMKDQEPSIKASIKKVSICMIPDTLGDPIFAHLTSLKTENFIFSREYQNADIVITNDEDLLLQALAENKNPLEVDLALPMEKTLARLARRFN